MPKKLEQIDAIERRDAVDKIEARVLSGKISVGQAIREIRQDILGLRQKDLAQMIKISKNTLGAIERGEGYENVSTLAKVLKPLGYRITIVPDIRQ